jgi:sugar lactone lactonase YvrE
MDETSLRAQLELAVSAEPPIGHLVGNSLRAGRRLRRRRQAAGAASLSAAAVVVVSIVPALTFAAGHKAGHKVSKPEPVAVPAPPAGGAGTAYVAVNQNTVVPISLATNTAGTPIKAPESIPDPFITSAAATPNGRTVYEVGSDVGSGTPVTPIDTATNTAGPAIRLGDVGTLQGIAVAPDGKAAYLSATGGLVRISTGTNTVSRLRGCPPYGCGAMAFTPNGKSLYVINHNALKGPRTVTVIRTSTNAVRTRITLPVPESGRSFLFNIAVTPNGKTAYVVDGMYDGDPGTSSVVPISVATNTPLAPIKIPAAGEADGLVIAPDGQTAYVLSMSSQTASPFQVAVTPIDLATNKAEPAINLPESADAYYMALTPDGKTLYVLAPHGVIPISTASGTVLPTIKVPKLCSTYTNIAITPNGETIYVGACITGTRIERGHRIAVTVGGGVVPISTASNTAGHFINLGEQPIAITFAP